MKYTPYYSVQSEAIILGTLAGAISGITPIIPITVLSSYGLIKLNILLVNSIEKFIYLKRLI